MPFYCDYHMHSHHSFDAKHSIREMAEAAVQAGLSEICFTDHIDFEDPNWRDVPADLPAQRAEIEREQPSLQVKVLHGVEVTCRYLRMRRLRRNPFPMCARRNRILSLAQCTL